MKRVLLVVAVFPLTAVGAWVAADWLYGAALMVVGLKRRRGWR